MNIKFNKEGAGLAGILNMGEQDVLFIKDIFEDIVKSDSPEKMGERMVAFYESEEYSDEQKLIMAFSHGFHVGQGVVMDALNQLGLVNGLVEGH